jgi:hypothetical protein
MNVVPVSSVVWKNEINDFFSSASDDADTIELAAALTAAFPNKHRTRKMSLNSNIPLSLDLVIESLLTIK